MASNTQPNVSVSHHIKSRQSSPFPQGSSEPWPTELGFSTWGIGSEPCGRCTMRSIPAIHVAAAEVQ